MKSKVSRKLALHSVPRSGSTWLGNIIDSSPEVVYKYQPLFSYRFKNRLDENTIQEDVLSFFDELIIEQDEFLDQTIAKNKGIIPQFSKNESRDILFYKEVRYHHVIVNILDKDPDIKFVLLIRNPLSTLNSWIKHPNEFKMEEGWKVEEEWQFAAKKNQNKPEEFFGYEKWKEAALLFIKINEMYKERICLVEYKALLQNTLNEVERIFSFCGLELTNQTLSFIQDSTQKTLADHYSVFREKQTDDKWKTELPEYIAAYIYEDLKGTILARYL